MCWRLAQTEPAPKVILAEVQPGAPLVAAAIRSFPFKRVSGFADLWEVPVRDCGLEEGRIYHYWFEVALPPTNHTPEVIRITDPAATMVDWRVLAPRARDFEPFPAAVVRFEGGRLVTADCGAPMAVLEDIAPTALPPNNQLVLYELPAAWTRQADAGGRDTGVGSFRDVTAMLDPAAIGDPFSEFELTRGGRAYLIELGINGLELTPPADSFYNRQWGCGTTNYFTPDFELGFPKSYAFPAPNRDLTELVRTCHARGIRVFADVVMAFSKHNPYRALAPDDFFIFDPKARPDDPDAFNSRHGTDRNFRDGFGSDLFRYARQVDGYDPITGRATSVFPARQLMLTALTRWMTDFHIDGFRLDSIENVQNWDFIQEFRERAHQLNRVRFAAAGAPEAADARMLVHGEELEEPLSLLDPRQRRLDGLWHEKFKHYVRAALLGQNHHDESTFEATVRKVIDCRAFGYRDLSEATIYLTSHDVEGFRNERLFDFFHSNGVADKEKRTKLAFACLLTAVGVPLILAGEEFADQHDLFDAKGNVTQAGGKQVDPVNFTRLHDDWRERLRQYVSRLIRLRTTSPALGVNDVDFIHVDFDAGKRVLAWKRGLPNSSDMVVVVANFSDYVTPNPEAPGAEYVVTNWPATPPGRRWREVPQGRDVPPEWVGREPIYAWEAKVYQLV